MNHEKLFFRFILSILPLITPKCFFNEKYICSEALEISGLREIDGELPNLTELIPSVDSNFQFLAEEGACLEYNCPRERGLHCVKGKCKCLSTHDITWSTNDKGEPTECGIDNQNSFFTLSHGTDKFDEKEMKAISGIISEISPKNLIPIDHILPIEIPSIDEHTTVPIVTSPITTVPIVTPPITKPQIITSPITTPPITTQPIITPPITSGSSPNNENERNDTENNGEEPIPPEMNPSDEKNNSDDGPNEYSDKDVVFLDPPPPKIPDIYNTDYVTLEIKDKRKYQSDYIPLKRRKRDTSSTFWG